MAGLSSALGGLSAARHTHLNDYLILAFAPVYGAALGKAILRDGRFVYGILLAFLAWLGLWIGLWTRPYILWSAPLQNSIWVAACALAGSLLAILPLRHPSESFRTERIASILVAALLTLLYFTPELLRLFS